MIRLIMSDMDGTLLDEDGRIPEGFDEVAAMLKAHNILFVPASGRQYYTLVQQFEKYKDEFIFVAENGTYVSYKQKELFSTPLGRPQIERVLAQASLLPDIYPVLCGKKHAYVNSDYRPFIKEIEKYYINYKLVDDLTAVEDDFIKIALCDCDIQDAENTIYRHIENFQPELKVALSSSLWVDVMDPRANKGLAVRQLQQTLQISPEECVAFGDYMNDYEMMGAVHYSYAMENAHPQLKAAARFQAKSNREGGVLLAIKELVASLK